MALRGLLLDSGDTLIGPRGGRWNPRYDFDELLIENWPDLPVDRLAGAVAAGERFMASHPGTPPYVEYYRVILDHLGLSFLGSDQELLAVLLPPRHPAEVVEMLPDVVDALHALNARGVPMVVVSDAWAGLEQIYADLGVAHYFAGFVISETLGCRKPDPRMYHTGSKLLGLHPEECLFVDDHAPHVEAAIALGYHGRVMAPSRAGTGGGSISSLLDLVALF